MNMQNMYNQLLGQSQFLSGYAYSTNDNRTDRERLNHKLEANSNSIKELQRENSEIEEAIKLLDQHPMIEKLSNLLRKLEIR